MLAEKFRLRKGYVKALKSLSIRLREGLKTSQDLDDYNALMSEIRANDEPSGTNDLEGVSHPEIKRLRKKYDSELLKLEKKHLESIEAITNKMVPRFEGA